LTKIPSHDQDQPPPSHNLPSSPSHNLPSQPSYDIKWNEMVSLIQLLKNLSSSISFILQYKKQQKNEIKISFLMIFGVRDG